MPKFSFRLSPFSFTTGFIIGDMHDYPITLYLSLHQDGGQHPGRANRVQWATLKAQPPFRPRTFRSQPLYWESNDAYLRNLPRCQPCSTPKICSRVDSKNTKRQTKLATHSKVGTPCYQLVLGTFFETFLHFLLRYLRLYFARRERRERTCS